MNRNNSALAGMLVGLTVLGVFTLPTKGPPSGSGEEKRSKAGVGKKGAKESAPYSPCGEIAKRLRRFVTDPAPQIKSWQLPDSCYESSESRNERKPVNLQPGIGIAIAIAPDPVATHLPLLFDRIVESAQQAAQDDNYTYDSSWFPWETESKQYDRLADQQDLEELQEIQQSQPGVMIFRQALHASGEPYHGGLIIFVVGEQPTGGIRDDQFKNALDWISRLRGQQTNETLKILGPTFSGSLPSLQLALERFAGKRRIIVSSGTVSSPKGLLWFNEWLTERQDGSVFRTAMENDSLMVNRFCQYLRDQSYDINHVAFLSEDETAFGRGTPDPEMAPAKLPCTGAIDLYYPRDIATLRSAYEQQSVLNAAKAPANNATPATTLRSDLSEPSTSDHDTLRSYGGQLTALAQEAILLDIINRLNERNIQFIVLRSTSSLDQIFLSQFLRRAYQEGRVVIDGADLLFTRGADGRSLRGVMTLSTYPLLTTGQDWTPSLRANPNGGYRSFGEDTAEGVYIAARALLFDDRLGTEIPIHDYSPPAWAPNAYVDQSQRPGTWIGVIGRRQLWPLAMLNMKGSQVPSVSWTLQTSEDRGDGNPFIESVEINPVRIPTMMWMFLIACLAWMLIHYYFCSESSITHLPRALAYFTPIDRRQHPLLVAMGSVILAMLAITLASYSGILSQLRGLALFLYPLADAKYSALILIVILIGALASYVVNVRIRPLSSRAKPENNTLLWRWLVGVLACVVLILFVEIQRVLLAGLTGANKIPMFWRSVNLLSGVSPMLPELLLMLGAYLWFWCNLRGLAHFGDDRPLLPAADDLPPNLPMFSSDRAGFPVEVKALPLTVKSVLRILVLYGLTILIAALGLQGFWIRTLGEREFGSFIFFWICLAIAVILSDGIQVWRAWSGLRKLLVFLDRLPLRRTIRSLKGLAWGSVWKMGGNVLEERYRVITFQIECLRHLSNTLAEWAPETPEEVRAQSKTLLRLSQCNEKVRSFAQWYIGLEKGEAVLNLCCLKEFQTEMAATAAVVVKEILLPAWVKEKKSLIFGRPEPAKSEEQTKVDVEIQTDELSPHVRAAEEFFVLPYLAYIQNMLGRLRTMALGSLWLFVGATFAVSSYPFDPLNVLGGLFLTVFAITGGLTILVYSQMSRDATLSHITNTKPGELGIEFWMRLLGFGVGPLIGLLTTLFPSITDFAFSWLQPSVEALK